MKISVSFTPDLAEFMRREILAAERAVTLATRDAAAQLQSDWRNQIVRAGLGVRLANSVRREAFPENGESLAAAGLVWTNAPKIIAAFNRGVTIRSKRGYFLAIPTEAAPPSTRGGRITPAEFERRTGVPLQFVYRPNGPSLLVAEGRFSQGKRSQGKYRVSMSKTGRGRTTIPIFVLVPQTRLRKRLDLERDVDRAVARLPSMIVERWADG